MKTKTILALWAGALLLVLVATAVVVSLWGCSECTPSEVRCQGSVLEICAGDERWAESQDCSEIVGAGGELWMCCIGVDAGEPECLPAEECP